jgi:two-component system sensor histidine kinase ChvG
MTLLARLRRLAARLSIRLLAFNLLLVFVPAAGVLYLDVYERQLLSSLEAAMVQQGRVLAAALGAAGVSAAGGLDPAVANAVLSGLEQRQTARLRVLDREGWVIADSSQLGPRLPTPTPTPSWYDAVGLRGATARNAASRSTIEERAREPRENPVYRLGSAIYGLYRRAFGPPEAPLSVVEPFPADRPLRIAPVEQALAGRYGAETLISREQRSVTLYSAIPVRSGERVVGAVLVSASTLRALTDLYEVRLAVFRVVLASLVVAVLLSLFTGATIVRPLHRLRAEAAALLDRRGRLRGTFGGSRRADEIGDLARALEELSRRVGEHLAFVEAFAGDVSHELKNPLASIRNAAEMLEEGADPAERAGLLAIVQREVARLERLLEEVREMARLDAQVEEEPRPRVQLDELLPALVSGVRRRAPAGVGLELLPGDAGLAVSASPDRLAQVVENLLDNALSFAPAGTAVTVRAARDGGRALVVVEDGGPGVPPQHLERVFSRFFTYRPAGSAAGRSHSGLGLAIVKAIVEAYGGSVSVANRAGGGARFTVALPLA